MRAAGFVDVERVDLTAEYRVTHRAWVEAWEQAPAAFVALHGAEAYQETLDERRETLVAIEDGLLRRSLVLGWRR